LNTAFPFYRDNLINLVIFGEIILSLNEYRT